MKKFKLLFLFSLLAGGVLAQPKIGLTFSPSLSTNRVKFKSDQLDISPNGGAVKFKFGMEADFAITDTYSFSTGVIYAPKRLAFTITPDGEQPRDEVYKTQYLQLPLTMKLYTSEVVPDIKAFFQLGVLAEIKIYSEPQEDSYTLVEKIRPFDSSFVFGVGVERNAGTNSTLYAALVYNRGLINAVSKTDPDVSEELVTKLDMFSIQLGIKF